MNRISENNTIVYALKPGDHQAGVALDSIDMGKCYVACYLIQFAALTGDSILTFKSGASAGTQTTAESFRYKLADAVQAAAAADTFAGWTVVTTLTLTAATYQNKVLIVEIDSATLTAGQPWLTGALSAAASGLNASVVVVVQVRQSDEDGVTVIT